MDATATIKLTMGRREWGFLFALTVCWSMSFFFVEVALRALPPFTIVWLRVGLAALTLHVVVWLGPWKLPKGLEVWRAFFIMGFMNNVVPFSLIVWGQTQIHSGVAAILNAMTPIMTLLVAHFYTADERLSSRRGVGMVLGFCGAAALVGLDALEGFGGNVLGQLAILGATVCYAFSGTFARRFRRMGITPIQSATGQLTASTLWLLPLMVLVEQPWRLPMPSLEVWAAVTGLAVISTAMAYILFYAILGSSGVTNVMLVTFLVPVGAIWLGWSFLGEVLEPRHFAAMAMIAAGLMVIDGRLFRLLSSRRG